MSVSSTEDGVPDSTWAAFLVDTTSVGPGYNPATEEPSGWAALDLDVSTAEPTELDDAALIDGIVAFERASAWAAARQARLLAEFARRRPGDDPESGLSDKASVVSRYAPDEVGLALHLSRLTAKYRLAHAAVLDRLLTDTRELWESGRIDTAKVRMLCDAVVVLDDEKALLVQARVLRRAAQQTSAQFRASIARAIAAVDPDGAARRHEQAKKGRRVVLGAEADGMATLWALLPAHHAMSCYQWLTRLAHAMGAHDPRSIDARRADLLTELLTGQLTAIDATGTDAAVDATGTDAAVDATGTDATGADAAGTDAAGTDAAGPHDAGLDDAGLDDAGLDDAGRRRSTGFHGAAPPDAAPPHAALHGAGLHDAGPQAAGPHDAGPRCAAIDDAVTDEACDPVPATQAGGGPAAEGAEASGRAGPGEATSREGPERTGPAVGTSAQRAEAGESPARACACGVGTRRRSGSRPVPAVPGKPLIHVVMPYSTLIGADDHPAQLVGYGPIPAPLAREIAADGVWKRLLTDPLSGALLDVGRTTYRPPQALADFVRSRDVECRSPVCRRRALDAELDHNVAWADGGATSSANLWAGCTHDHHLKHSPGWKVVLHPDASMTWTTPTGHSYRSEPHDYRPEPFSPPPQCQAGLARVGPQDQRDRIGGRLVDHDTPPF